MSTEYLALADSLLESGMICDPWLDGRPRFSAAPVVLSAEALAELYRAGEDVARVYDEASRLVAREPALLDDFYALTPWQKLMWVAEEPAWHGFARADVFRTQDGGIAVCELNSDTPTGEPEAVALGQIAQRGREGTWDPNARLGERFCAMVEAAAARRFERDRAHSGGPRPGYHLAHVGIVYPTEMSEDLAVIQLYQRWLEARGHTVALGSPFNVTASDDGGVAVMGAPCGIVLRHYKTDWWGERLPVWTDQEPFVNPQPLSAPLSALLAAVADARAVVVNPFGAVLTQNKRTMALMWERMAWFSEESQRTIRAHVPRTLRLEVAPVEELAAERDAWVLKSDYGCEGEEVYVGKAMTATDWEECLAKAIPQRWVAQRYFAARVNDLGESINHGVFVVAGEASGVYARIEAGMTTHDARSAPLLVTV